MRLSILFVPLLIACAPPATNTETGEASGLSIRNVGVLEERDLDEASGLARSGRDANVMWVINDDGPSEIHAIDSTGADLGRINIKDAKNNDWEDIASFSLHGTPYLLIADIGNSEHKWDKARLYVIEEPDPKDKKVDVAWRIDFRYPDGPRDAEAIAVDAESGRVLILSKRDIPAVLYEVPLLPNSKKVQDATRLGEIRSLPQPSRRDIEYAPKTDNYYWQPTGMDLAADGSAAVILTYGAVYHYPRDTGETWYDALQKRPAILGKTNNREAEAITFNPGGDAIFVTTEQRHAPLIRFDLGASSTPAIVTIMTFNVQNLFDNVDDAGKDDKAYLSIEAKQNDAHIAECKSIPVASWRDECLNLDWSDAAIDHKLSVLAETIKQVGNGRGADVIALQEVENVAILERLRTGYLGDSGYLPAILIEGQDVRGVDTAFLSKLPLASPATMLRFELPDYPDRVGDTRGLLEATFELPDGSLLTGYSVHFPAPFHPNEMQVLAYEHLNSVRSELPQDRNVFAAGDFNTSSSDDAEHQMLTRFVRPTWEVAHDACTGCPGTQYYAPDNNWSFLDMILYAPAGDEGSAWQIVPGSVGLANEGADQITEDGTPNRYRSAERTGVSDHWPVVMAIEPRP